MKRLILIVFCMFSSITGLIAQSTWSFELHGGDVFNVPMPLTIHQQGFPDIKITARYQTEALTLPVYTDVRLSRWQKDKSWELEFIHHKLYMRNTTPEIQKFNISHGFNMIIINRGFDKKFFRYRAGAGIVLAHPESKIRGKEFGDAENDFDMGYFISGPVLNLAIGKPFYFSHRFYLNTEVKTTFAYSNIKIAQGHADVYNLAFHFILGFGFDIVKSN